MSEAEVGATVRVHYTARFSDGTAIDSSLEGEPVEFTIGQGDMIPGVEEAVVGMRPGDWISAIVPPEKGYGERRDELTMVVQRTDLPPGLDPQVGDCLEIGHCDECVVLAGIVDVSDATVTLDANHPLAGHEVTYDIVLLEIV